MWLSAFNGDAWRWRIRKAIFPWYPYDFHLSRQKTYLYDVSNFISFFDASGKCVLFLLSVWGNLSFPLLLFHFNIFIKNTFQIWMHRYIYGIRQCIRYPWSLQYVKWFRSLEKWFLGNLNKKRVIFLVMWKI